MDILRKIDKVVMSIGNLRACAPKVGLAYNMQTQLRHPPERIRIAILDTGVDSENKMIRDSLKPHLITKQIRIKERKSWVGSDEQYQDICGHGTHVARLLLRIAPEAELYIAKISDQVDGGPESLQRIADVSFFGPIIILLEVPHSLTPARPLIGQWISGMSILFPCPSAFTAHIKM